MSKYHKIKNMINTGLGLMEGGRRERERQGGKKGRREGIVVGVRP